MDHLVTALYALSLLACCVGLWLWYEVETHKDHLRQLRLQLGGMEDRIQELENTRR